MKEQDKVVDLSPVIEHTLLRATATPGDIEALCREAAEHRFHAVCVSPIHVRHARAALVGSSCRVVSVAAFPLGASVPEVAADEAARLIADGASEVDMVIPLGLALAGDAERVTAQVAAVRQAVGGATLKVILETGYFEVNQLRRVCEWVLSASPDFLKTSTGFGPRGASVEDVQVLVEVAEGRAQVKAAGGIRTREQALSMLAAGATRLGTSCGVAIARGATS